MFMTALKNILSIFTMTAMTSMTYYVYSISYNVIDKENYYDERSVYSDILFGAGVLEDNRKVDFLNYD